MVLYVDVSQHDWDRHGGPLDWNAIRNAGLGTVMCARASYGDPQVFNPASPRFPADMANAKAAGFTCRGAYHNLIRGDQASINRQVDLLRSTMDKYGGEWAMADIEAYSELVANNLVPRWEDVQRFHDRWYQVESRVMAWYVAEWVWSGKLGSPNLTGLRGPLINANYPGVSGAPAQAAAALDGRGFKAFGGRKPDIWQFGSSLTVPGASSNTDCNLYPGTVAQLVQLLTGRPTGGEDDMLTFYRVSETGACGVSSGPTRWGFATMEDLNEALASQGKKLSDLRPIPAARINAYGADVTTFDDPPFVLTDDMLASVGTTVTKSISDAMPGVVDALIAKLPANAMTREDVESAVRDAFAGGLAPDADAPVA